MKELVHLNSDGYYWPINDVGSWEGQVRQMGLYPSVIAPYMKGFDAMVQAGGNCGLILNTFVPHFKHIYTFEPDPVNFYCLNMNVDVPNVTKIQACLGSAHETVGMHNYLPDIGGVHVSGAGFTPTFKIDDLGLSQCDLIQLDTEGYELNALEGAVETIKEYNPVLCVEICQKWLDRYHATPDKFEKFFKSIGYKQVDSYVADRIYVKENV